MNRLAAAVRTLALLGVCSASALAAADGDAAERARIAAERQAVEDRFEAARRDCQARFAVNACLEEARQARRAALEPLQRQAHLLDDARRRERAVERLRIIQAREADAAARPAMQPASAPAPQASEAPAPAASAAAPRPLVRRAVRPAAAASAAEQAARERQAQAQQRLQAAQAHQEAVEARNARRDARRKPSEPLPVPAAPAP